MSRETTGEIALAPAARPTWQVLGLIAAILGGAVALIGVDRVLGLAAAREVLQPVEKRLDDHLAEMKAKGQIMELYVVQEKERSASLNRTLEALNRKLDALCRASSRPQVCLGEDR